MTAIAESDLKNDKLARKVVRFLLVFQISALSIGLFFTFLGVAYDRLLIVAAFIFFIDLAVCLGMLAWLYIRYKSFPFQQEITYITYLRYSLAFGKAGAILIGSILIFSLVCLGGCLVLGAIASATPTYTHTPSPANTQTLPATATFTSIPTDTFTPTSTASLTAVGTPSFTSTPTFTFTPSRTSTPTFTFTSTRTSTPTFTFTPTRTPTKKWIPTNTPIPYVPPTSSGGESGGGGSGGGSGGGGGGGGGGSNCDPSYPDVCIPPPPPDLNCPDISYRNFRVLPPDPHGFDRDKDGIGCEE